MVGRDTMRCRAGVKESILFMTRWKKLEYFKRWSWKFRWEDGNNDTEGTGGLTSPRNYEKNLSNMQGKPSSPLCQVWVHVSLRVAKQQMGGIPVWMHLLSKWKQRYGIGHAENKGEKRNNENGKIWNMQFSKWEKSSVKKERVSSTAYML